MNENEAARLEVQEARAKLLMVLVQLVVVAWFLIPSHRRRYILMRLVEGSRRLLDKLALRSGHMSMGTELKTGQQEYQLTSAISLSRDQMAAVYERLRSN